MGSYATYVIIAILLLVLAFPCVVFIMLYWRGRRLRDIYLPSNDNARLKDKKRDTAR